MFRWSYIFPRLLIMLTICLFFRYGSDPLIKYALTYSAESVLGAKVEIGEVRSAIAQGDFYVADLQIADPRDPSRNLLQAEHALLKTDRDALLHRKYVIDEGRISGMRFRTERQTDGSLPETEANYQARESEIADQLKQVGEQWLDGLLERTEDSLRNEFETVRVTEDLMRRWPQEYRQINADVGQWQAKLDNLQRVYDELRVNPLRGLEYYQQRLGDLQQVQQELVRIRQESERLQQQLVTDRSAIARAKAQDEAKVREILQVENLAPEQLSQYLLGQEVATQISNALVWVARGREVVELANAKPNHDELRGCGMVIPFETHPSPDILIRSLAFNGITTHEQQEVAFQGKLMHATSQPRIHQQPARLSIATKGAIEMQMEAILDRTGDAPIDRFNVTCPNLAQPERMLGSPQKLGVSVAPGRSLVSLHLQITGDQCEGTLALQQDDVHLAAHVSDQLGGSKVAERINGALFAVNSLQTQVHLSGDIRQPSVALESNLGPALTEGIHGAFVLELDSRREQLVARVDERLAQETQRFDNFIETQQQQLLDKLDVGQSQLGDFQELLAKRLDGSGTFSARRLLDNTGKIKNLFQ